MILVDLHHLFSYTDMITHILLVLPIQSDICHTISLVLSICPIRSMEKYFYFVIEIATQTLKYINGPRLKVLFIYWSLPI